MKEDNPIAALSIIPQTSSKPSNSKPFPVSFNRKELNEILKIYGYKVSDGEWKDYAIDLLTDKAVFSIFRRSSEYPLYKIIKNPKLAKKQGAFSIVTTTGLILKRGHELRNVLKVFEKKPKLVEQV